MVNESISRAISSLRWNDSQRIEYVSNEGYQHCIVFGRLAPPFKRRVWVLDGTPRPLSTVVWQLFENADKKTIRLLGALDRYPL
jgi:hypothetical protein